MWRATPERVRALRQRYEDTDRLISSIAAVPPLLLCAPAAGHI